MMMDNYLEPNDDSVQLPAAVEEKEPTKHEAAVKVESLEPGTTTSRPYATAATSTPDDKDEAAIQQVIRFWNHPSLRDVSAAQKQEYLKQKGISNHHIFQAWDRMLLLQQNQQPSNTVVASSSDLVSSFQSQLGQQQGQQSAPTQTKPPLFGSTNQPNNYNFNANNQIPSTYPHHNTTTNPQHGTPFNYPPPQYDYDVDFSEEPTPAFSPNTVALIAAVGGFVGLLAAATVRWLNGGDFQVFPPPSRSVSINNEGASSAAAVGRTRLPSDHLQNVTEEQEEEEDDEDAEQDQDQEQGHEEEEDEEYDELARYLSTEASLNAATNTPRPDVLQHVMAQVTTLSETFQQHVTLQQRILQKLTSTTSSTGNVTDASMQVLRDQLQRGQPTTNNSSTTATITGNTPPDPMTWYKLVEIQVQLVNLQQQQWNTINKNAKANGTKHGERLEKKLEETLEQLQQVLQDLKPPKQSPIEKQQQNTDMGDTTTTTTSTLALTNQETKTKEAPLAIVESSTGDVSENLLASSSLPPPSETTTPSIIDNHADPLEPQSPKEAANDTLVPPSNVGVDNETTTKDVVEEAFCVRRMRKAFIDLVRQNAEYPTTLKFGIQMLFLYISNLSKNPHVPRYRKIFTSNESFKKVECLVGGQDLLMALGFKLSDDKRVLEWASPEPDADGTPKTLTTKEREELVELYHLKEAVGALEILKSIESTSSNEKSQDAILTCLEQALDVLPCPPPASEPAVESALGLAED